VCISFDRVGLPSLDVPQARRIALRWNLTTRVFVYPSLTKKCVGQPVDVGRPTEVRVVFAAHQRFTPRLHQLAVVAELEELMQVVIHDPHVFLRVVLVHLDLVRPPRALLSEDRVVLRPRLHHLAIPIDNEDAVRHFCPARRWRCPAAERRTAPAG
jgi:hypothetical protein